MGMELFYNIHKCSKNIIRLNKYTNFNTLWVFYVKRVINSLSNNPTVSKLDLCKENTVSHKMISRKKYLENEHTTLLEHNEQ